ncbi:DUF2796 domain-containing protein [Marinobacterium marinum]|uniref:DUF2796 domain-containing protein n=1 Tax=Marinobacterium marinum TaxID=2756129 RepID=A0A7W2ACQ7_9GAMM|nr:DUF2796 domain-containing protein [Marinobacterium marinum]MBA4502363.1 DUF2796 domain-containing protein [Marinobacterium marinum]
MLRPPHALLLALLPLPGLMAAGVHQHGVAQLDLVIEPPLIAVAFSSPLANLTGFEHAPSTADEQQIWDRALAQLRRSEELIRLPAAADCSLSRADLHLPFIPETGQQTSTQAHAHDHAHEGSDTGHHADLMAEYQYLCANSAALEALEFPLMQVFPAIERLDIQSITPTGQHRHTLTHGQTRL